MKWIKQLNEILNTNTDSWKVPNQIIIQNSYIVYTYILYNEINIIYSDKIKRQNLLQRENT